MIIYHWDQHIWKINIAWKTVQIYIKKGHGNRQQSLKLVYSLLPDRVYKIVEQNSEKLNSINFGKRQKFAICICITLANVLKTTFKIFVRINFHEWLNLIFVAKINFHEWENCQDLSLLNQWKPEFYEFEPDIINESNWWSIFNRNTY